jgi:pimeloyl-ACP methyl ester carboxylesterase
MPTTRSVFHQAGTLRMHALEAGEPSGPLVVLLHGFPESSESWREVLPTLAAAGFHAVAPDLRGYARTEKPDSGYDLDTLADDVVQLVLALGRERAHVVGHDWGGVVAYHLAATRPAVVDRLVVVNAPHPADIARRIWNPKQLVRSWYVFAFQVPFLPELWLTRNDASVVARMMRGFAIDKTNFTRERLRIYTANFADFHAASKPLAYYRRAFSLAGILRLRGYPRIRAPFRLVWGTEDRALRRQLAQGLERWVEPPVDVRYLERVGHFVPVEAPDRLASLVVEHLQGQANQRAS